MTAKTITFKLPDELIQAIDSYADATGRDRTAVVVQALKKVFGLLPSELPQAGAIDELSKLKARLSKIEMKIASHTEQIAELSRVTSLDNSVIQHITTLSEHLVNSVQQVEEVKPQATDILASNYLQIEDFLTLEEKSRLLDHVFQQESAFIPTYTLTGAPDHRRSMVLYSFPDFSESIVNRVQAIIPYIINKLKIPSFSVSQIETQLTAHNDGNYYKIHNDDGVPEISNRELSYVYYFYREPKPFSGGELLIYDSKIENNLYIATETFKTVEPRNNSIVFFLSRYMHEILPVICPSKAFADSRFTVNGWVRR